MNGYLRRLGAQALQNAAGIRLPDRSLSNDKNAALSNFDSGTPLSASNAVASAEHASALIGDATVLAIRAPHIAQGDVSRVESSGNSSIAGVASYSTAASAGLLPSASIRAPAASAADRKDAAPRNAVRVEASEDFVIAADTGSIAGVERPQGYSATANGIRPARQRSQSPAVTAPHADPSPEWDSDQPRARSDAAPAPDGTLTRLEMNSRTVGAAETPDVHIHIGRVELTAIAAPAAPRRVPSNTKAPMSLDEYLRRRDGRAP